MIRVGHDVNVVFVGRVTVVVGEVVGDDVEATRVAVDNESVAFIGIDHVAAGVGVGLGSDAGAVVEENPVLHGLGEIRPSAFDIDTVAAVAEDGVAPAGDESRASNAARVVLEDLIPFHQQGAAPNPDGFVVTGAIDAVAADDAVATSINALVGVIVDVAVGDHQIGGAGEIDCPVIIRGQLAAQHLHAVTQIRTAAFDVNGVVAVHDLE